MSGGRGLGLLVVLGAGLAGALGMFLLVGGDSRRRRVSSPASIPAPPALPRGAVVDAIRHHVRERLGRGDDQVERAVIAFADLESGLGRDVTGDEDWAMRHPRKFEQFVLGNIWYDQNPYRTDRGAWMSYGYFHLLAPHWLDKAIQLGLLPPDAHPSALAIPVVNLTLAVPRVLELLTHPDNPGRTLAERFVAARYRFVGCDWRGAPPCPAVVRERVARRARDALATWGLA